tara:strand:+ start:6138 stop:7001 length:864 start_codon:yes stop_codon:yes gene_type:complete
MDLEYPLVHVNDVTPEKLNLSEGWPDGEYRIVLDKKHGCSSTIYYSILASNAVHKKHKHSECDEMYYVVSGHALAGVGPDRVEIFSGHYHYIPKGIEHWLVNLNRNEPLVLIGIYDRCPSFELTGYDFLGDIPKNDMDISSRTLRTKDLKYHLVHDDSVPLVKVSRNEGWTQDYFCEPINRSHGAETCWMYGYFGPKTIHMKHKHKFCEEVCYALKGSGYAGVGNDRVDFNEGHFHYIPRNTEHWLANLSEEEVLIAPGFYIGVGGLDESGFEYIGPVTDNDLKLKK